MNSEVTPRELDIDSLVLGRGSHSENNDMEMCIMEAVAYVAGEPWSDRPECASRVIAAFLRRLNDRADDEHRQLLKPYIIRLVGTAADVDVERERAWACADWVIRECLPLMFEARGDVEKARRFREMDQVTADNWRTQRDAAAAYAAAAHAAAYAADAYDAAYAAAAHAAAYAADAYDAAYAAAAYAAAYAADAYAPIFASALSLVDRLLEIGK